MPRLPIAAALLATSFLAALGACGSAGHAPEPARAWEDPGSVSAGPWSLYYSAFPAKDLAPELATEYGVAANGSRALVVVSLAHADHRPVPAEAAVTIIVEPKSVDGNATKPVGTGPYELQNWSKGAAVTLVAHTLSGTERAVGVRRVEREGAVSWLGELDVSQREMLVFTVSAKPDASTPPITAQFRRELYLD